MKRFLIHTFGCQMNMHDSARIAESLANDGYAATDSPELADVIVFNTCSVREKAEHKLQSALGRLRPLKDSRGDLVIAVAGCMAQEHGASLLDRLDLVDVLVGPDNVGDLPGLVDAAQKGGVRGARAEFDVLAPHFLGARPDPSGREVCAFVTVMKGCDERCSFCIVPYTRGPERYRPADEIVAEIDALCAAGVREVTLLGQTVNSWHDPRLPAPASGDASQFPELLRRIAREVPALARLRYTSPHPRHVTEALVSAHAELAVLCPHVHLPVQSGSDRVLRRMIRRYTRAHYIERARALMGARDRLSLSTDIIVGFPGETEDDFQQTLSLVEAVGFSTAFGFKYSPRPQTPALRLGDDVPEALKAERLERLFEVVDRFQQKQLAALVGTRTCVLIEGRSKIGPQRFSGRSDRHEIVHVEAPSGVDLTGAMLDVEIVAANKRSLVGRQVGVHLVDPTRTSTRPRAFHLPIAPSSASE